jgi:hypothetical protein
MSHSSAAPLIVLQTADAGSNKIKLPSSTSKTQAARSRLAADQAQRKKWIELLQNEL